MCGCGPIDHGVYCCGFGRSLTEEERKRLLERRKLHLQTELKWIEEELAGGK
jgi:hypothetical protein